MDIDHAIPLLIGHFLHHGIPRVSRVVNKDIQLSKLINGRLDDLLRNIRCGHISQAEGGLPTNLLDCRCGLLGRVLIHIMDNYGGPLLSKHEGCFPTDPTS